MKGIPRKSRKKKPFYKIIDKSELRIKRKRINIKKRRGKCAECGNNKDLTIHHKIPLCNGGDESTENLEVLCKKCHNKKHKN